jgi:acyl carrier protein
MTQSEIIDKVKQIIIDQIEDNMTILHNDTDLYEELNLDLASMDSIVLEIEDEFKIELPQADIDPTKTVGEIIDYVSCKVKSG